VAKVKYLYALSLGADNEVAIIYVEQGFCRCHQLSSLFAKKQI
jgi:hypothetical protein